MGRRCECGVEMIFRRHVRTGRWAAIDPVPAPNGNIRLLPGGEYEVLAGAALQGADPPLYLDHHVTCRNREEWRQQQRELRGRPRLFQTEE